MATFAINNVNERLPNLVNWLKRRRPDVVCLQELKCETAAYPGGHDAILAGDYNVAPTLGHLSDDIVVKGRICAQNILRGPD